MSLVRRFHFLWSLTVVFLSSVQMSLDGSDSESYRRGEKRSLDSSETGSAIGIASKRPNLGAGMYIHHTYIHTLLCKIPTNLILSLSVPLSVQLILISCLFHQLVYTTHTGIPIPLLLPSSPSPSPLPHYLSHSLIQTLHIPTHTL